MKWLDWKGGGSPLYFPWLPHYPKYCSFKFCIVLPTTQQKTIFCITLHYLHHVQDLAKRDGSLNQKLTFFYAKACKYPAPDVLERTAERWICIREDIWGQSPLSLSDFCNFRKKIVIFTPLQRNYASFITLSKNRIIKPIHPLQLKNKVQSTFKS